jgi:hypothetical protein
MSDTVDPKVERKRKMILALGVAWKDGSGQLLIHSTVLKRAIASGVRDPDCARVDAAMTESTFASQRSFWSFVLQWLIINNVLPFFKSKSKSSCICSNLLLILELLGKFGSLGS